MAKRAGDNSNKTAAGGAGDESANFAPHLDTERYYRRLRRLLQIGLLTAYLVPLAVLSVYFHFQFNYTLKNSGKLHLITLAESQRNTIDLFLQERVLNIYNLYGRTFFKLAPKPDDMRLLLQCLNEMSDAFVDVGFLDPGGIQIGYAGPYHYLKGRDYSRESWYRTLMRGDKNYLITDIYLGFRNKPHFTIAVRQLLDGKMYVIRSTLDPDKFYMFLRDISREKGEDSYIINRRSEFQVVDPDRGELLGVSSFIPPKQTGSDASEIISGGSPELVAYAWLEETPWMLVVTQPLQIAYAEMYRARWITITATLLFIAVLGAIILTTTNRLLLRAQKMEISRMELRSQLFHASKLVSIGELASGVAHEINNPLAIIASESGLIRDMLDPQFGMKCTPENIIEELDNINVAIFRARDITQKLLSFVHKTEPKLEMCNLNSILDEVVGGLKERELELSNIRVIRQYDPDLPEILVDPDQMRQVFLNIVNNAGAAIEGKGSITIRTGCDEKFMRVTISDTGRGMTSEQTAKIFYPFYTTKEVGKGTGLGLSVSMSIVQLFGGAIEVQSMPGAGSSFTVVLPVDRAKTDTRS